MRPRLQISLGHLIRLLRNALQFSPVARQALGMIFLQIFQELFSDHTAEVPGIAGIARIHQSAQLDGMLRGIGGLKDADFPLSKAAWTHRFFAAPCEVLPKAQYSRHTTECCPGDGSWWESNSEKDDLENTREAQQVGEGPRVLNRRDPLLSQAVIDAIMKNDLTACSNQPLLLLF
jgi:hypothetical protein